MHPALSQKMVQSHIADLHRAAASDALRAEARRANTERRAPSSQVLTLPRLSIRRRLAGRLAH